MKRDQQKFLAAITRLFEDQQPLHIETSKQQMWCLLTAVQLACRHPKFNGPTRKIVEPLARQIGVALVANDTDLKMLFEMGWREEFDE